MVVINEANLKCSSVERLTTTTVSRDVPSEGKIYVFNITLEEPSIKKKFSHVNKR